MVGGGGGGRPKWEFFAHRRHHHCRWRYGNDYLCSPLMANEQWEIFNVQYLLWHERGLLYNCQNRYPFHKNKEMYYMYIYILLSFLLDNSRVVKTYVCLLSKEIDCFCMFLYILNFICTNLLLFFIYFLFTHTNKTHSVLKWIY